MAFRSEAVEAAANLVDRDVDWRMCEGRKFGLESGYALRIKIGTGGTAWNRGFVKGCQVYARKLSGSKQRQFAKNCTNPATMDSDALVIANRSAIRVSGILKEVAYAGPTFENEEKFRAWVAGQLPLVVSGESEEPPKDPDSYFRQSADGSWSIPLSVDPPEEYEADEAQIFKLLAYDEFLLQVGVQRRILEEEGAQSEDDELGNLLTGLEPPPAGPSSVDPLEQATTNS